MKKQQSNFLLFNKLVNFLISIFILFIIFIFSLNYFFLSKNEITDLFIVTLCCINYFIIISSVIYLLSCFNNLLLNSIIKNYNLIRILNIIIILLYIYLFIKYSDFTFMTVMAEEPDVNSLKQILEAEKSDFEQKNDLFKAKVDNLRGYFHSITTRVEYSMVKDEYLPVIKEPIEESNDDAKVNAYHARIYHMQVEVKQDATDLLERINRMRSIDKQIHGLANINYSDQEYASLYENIAKYRVRHWYLAQSENVGRFVYLP